MDLDRSSCPAGTRFIYRRTSMSSISEDVIVEWSGSGDFVKFKNLGWLSSKDLFHVVLLEILDSPELDDEGMCPNCVTPWKCNGPHECD